MIAEEVKDIKKIMSKLLVGNDFDEFLVNEVSITTFNTFHIDGHIVKEFFDMEELEEMGNPVMSKWKDVKSICYELIKGKKTPLRFKIIFAAPQGMINNIVNKADTDISAVDVRNLFLNLKYEGGKMTYVTGTSLSIFTMDKSVENSFDESIRKYMSRYL